MDLCGDYLAGTTIYSCICRIVRAAGHFDRGIVTGDAGVIVNTAAFYNCLSVVAVGVNAEICCTNRRRAIAPPCALARVGISALPTNPKSIQNMDFIRPPCSAISNGIRTPYCRSLYHNSRLTGTTFRQRLYLKSQAGRGSGVTKSARHAKPSGAQKTRLGRRPVQRQAGPPEGGRYEEMLREDFGDAGDGPVDFVALDNEGRGDADDGVVGFLAEEAFVFEGFAIGTGVGVQFDREP